MSFNHPCKPEMHDVFETLKGKKGSHKLVNYKFMQGCSIIKKNLIDKTKKNEEV